MKLLGLDLETTGLSFDTDHITEIGLVLWDTDKNAPIQIASSFIDSKNRPAITPMIEKLTGITDEMLATYGVGFDTAITEFLAMAEKSDYIVAHNGYRFDKPMLASHCIRHGFQMPDLPWLDTFKDVPYPDSVASRKLSYLASDHGFINPFPHRALFDVLTMLKIVSCYDINEVVRYSKMKDVTLRALVSFNEKDWAKEDGYKWNGEEKIWVKTIKEDQVQKAMAQQKFKVVIMEKK